MSNSIFNAMNGNKMLQSFNQFKNGFRGDPRRQIQQMLNNGQITQAQYDAAVQKANEFKQMFGINA